MSIFSAIASSERKLVENFSISDEDPLSNAGLYTTTNLYNYVSASPARFLDLTSRIVSQVLTLKTQGKTINSGALETRGVASSKSLSKINKNYLATYDVPITFKGTTKGDTRVYEYNIQRDPSAGFTIGIGVDSATNVGLWVSVLHNRVNFSAGGQRIVLCAGSLPFGTDYLDVQTIINESTSPENVEHSFILNISKNKIYYKIWKSTDSEPGSFSSFTYTSAPTASKSNIFIGQKSHYPGINSTGEYWDNPVIHYLDNLELHIYG